MEILKTRQDVILWRNKQHSKIGFVPTMGALHNGHLSLMEQSIKDNDKTIVSIFVNPTQFGANEDFDKYPKTHSKDIELCEKAGVSAVLMPDINQMYISDDETNIIPPQILSSSFEGELRKGHFSGVLRIVLKFFNLIRPNNAYFGQKDAQQLLIVKKMVSDLFLRINIIGCPIIRDENGLALSSRNTYLDSNAYKQALKIPQSINLAKEAFNNGILESSKIEGIIKNHLAPLEVDYCNVVDFNLKAISEIKKDNSLLLLAVRVAKVRLLDNIWF